MKRGYVVIDMNRGETFMENRVEEWLSEQVNIPKNFIHDVLLSSYMVYDTPKSVRG